jgi:hypothetical protein
LRQDGPFAPLMVRGREAGLKEVGA